MIIVCGLAHVHEQIALHGARSVIGILGPETAHPSLPGLARHLRLSFNDINEETAGLTAATHRDAEKLVDFIAKWDRRHPLLIHCWAGVSRSTASAFAALCMLRPDADEMQLARDLRLASPSASPNALITARVDQVLGRAGRMSQAIASIGRGSDAHEGKPFVLKV